MRGCRLLTCIRQPSSAQAAKLGLAFSHGPLCLQQMQAVVIVVGTCCSCESQDSNTTQSQRYSATKHSWGVVFAQH